MARTQRPPINMNNKASYFAVRMTLIEVNVEWEDMESIQKKIIQLLKINGLKVDNEKKVKRANYLNGQRLIKYYGNNPEKLPTLKELQPYPTTILNRNSVFETNKRQKIEIIDLTEN